MSSDKTQEIIDNIRRRISTLETIYDINVPIFIQKREKMIKQMKKCPIRFVGEATKGKVAESFGRAPLQTTVDLWTVTNGLIQNIQSLEIFKEFYKRDFSNGRPMQLILAHCKVNYRSPSDINAIDSKQVVVKFRELKKVDRTNKTFTEIEGQHAIDTFLNQETKYLFPFIYFIFSLECADKTWECIGTEPLEDVKVRQPGFYEDAFNLLKHLHDQGYIHGDPHSGNFMKLPNQSTHPKQNKSGVIMIDQDCITPIPTGIFNKALANYMIISDLNMLLQWNNPYFDVWHRFENDKQIEIAAVKLYMTAPNRSFARPPWFFAKLRDKPANLIQEYIDKTPEYKRYLAHADPVEIYKYYETLFKSPNNMMMANQTFIEFLSNKRY